MKKNRKEKSYFDRVHTWGRISSISALCVLFSFPLAICLYLNVWPPISGIIKGLLSFAIVFWASSVIEVFLYTPMLGAGGTYLSFVTGNIPNLKLPCALNAMEGAEVDPNSEEGEVVSTISIATSSIVTTIVLAVGVLAFAPFLDSFTSSPLLKPAFEQVQPALFGALAAGYFSKHWKISIFPILIMVVILIAAPNLGASTLLFPGIIASVGGAFVMWKLKLVK
ncbi:MAG: hypothetical protein ACI4SX_01860 [Candidatus Fimenecus sp.]